MRGTVDKAVELVFSTAYGLLLPKDQIESTISSHPALSVPQQRPVVLQWSLSGPSAPVWPHCPGHASGLIRCLPVGGRWPQRSPAPPECQASSQQRAASQLHEAVARLGLCLLECSTETVTFLLLLHFQAEMPRGHLISCTIPATLRPATSLAWQPRTEVTN